MAKAEGNLHGAVRQTVINFTTKLIDRTPYGQPDTWKRPAPPGYRAGAMKANWQLGVDSIPNGTLMMVDPTGAVTKDRIAAQIPKQAGGHIFTLANNLPYAWRLEADGWSHQAPFGFAAITVAEFNMLLAQSAAEAKAGRVAGAALVPA